MKVVAIFDVDENRLNEIEDGSFESAAAWCSESGVYLKSYETYQDDEKLPEISKN